MDNLLTAVPLLADPSVLGVILAASVFGLFVGSFAITTSVFGIAIMLALGLTGFLMEENGFPIAPVILGIVIGPMLEDNFMATVIKADGNIPGFFDRPVAGTLGVITVLQWTIPLIRMLLRKAMARSGAAA